MQKSITLLFVLVLGVFAVSAQRSYTTFGVHGGIPVGDLGSSYSSNFGADVGYLRLLSKESASKKLYVGATVSLTRYFGDERSESGQTTQVEDARFMPLTASIRLSPHKRILVGGDLGYALGFNGLEGGFYGSPRFNYVFDNIKAYAGYRQIFTDGEALGSVQFGIVYMIKR